MIGILRYMPELPEVETIKRRLQEILPGKKFSQVDVLHPKSFFGDLQQIIGQPVLDVTRKAKVLRFQLPNNLNILTHLKMTGQLIYADDKQRVGGGHPTADFVKDLPSKHTRITYTFDDNSKLYFNDQRIFGWMRVVPDEIVAAEFALFGPDATEDSITSEYLFSKLRKRGVPIKQAIMMNEIIAGVGNIYAADALNVAQLSPFRPANSLSMPEVERLVIAIKAIINEGIEFNGTTFDGKYVDVFGLTGTYQDRVKAYGRSGEKCYQCGGTIVKTTLGGRGTYYCSSCQQ